MFRKFVFSTTAMVLASSVALAAGAKSAAPHVDGRKTEETRTNDDRRNEENRGAGHDQQTGHQAARENAIRQGIDVLANLGAVTKSDRASKFHQQISQILLQKYGQNNPAVEAILQKAAELKVSESMSEAQVEEHLEALTQEVRRITKNNDLTVDQILNCAI